MYKVNAWITWGWMLRLVVDIGVLGKEREREGERVGLKPIANWRKEG